MPNVLFVSDSLPNIYHGGGGVTAHSIVISFLKNGFEVDIIALSSSVYNYNDRDDNFYVHELKSLGVSCISVLNSPKLGNYGIFHKFFPTFESTFSGYHSSNEIKKILFGRKYDLIFAYHWNSIASVYQIDDIPKFGIVGDPLHLPYLFRKEYQRRYSVKIFDFVSFKLKVLEFTQVLSMKKMMKRLLLSCDKSGAFAFHHSEDFVSAGVYNCSYFRTPVMDPFKNNFNLNFHSENQKFRILHIGHLLGIATISGVEILAEEIIPILDDLIGKENYEVHLVGGHFESLPASIRHLLNKDNVFIKGQISPADLEFLSCDVLLVPTPIELGIRVRIITGMSFGSCIVSHVANKRGIPELENKYNCMIGNNGESLANAIHQLYLNPELKEKIKINSRRTYEKMFSIDSAGASIEEFSTKLISKRKI